MNGTFRKINPGLVGLFLVAFVLFIAKLAPANIGQIRSGLDPSWQAALNYAFENNLVFGRDIVFTLGPYSPIFTSIYAGNFSVIIVGAVFAIAIFLAVGLALTYNALLPKLHPVAAVVFLLSGWLVIDQMPSRDGLFLVVPILTAVLYSRGGYHWLLISSGIILSAVLGLTKFNIFLFSLAAFLLIDILTLYRKRLPYHLVLFLAATLALFQFSGQNLTDFIPFVLSSLEVVSGYSAAMSVNGDILEILLWLVLAGLVYAMMIYIEISAARKKSSGYLEVVIRIMLLSGSLFIAFKTGFTRHDLHSLYAWGLLGFIAIVFIPQNIDWERRQWVLLFFFSIAFTTVIAEKYSFYAVTRQVGDMSPISTLEKFRTQVQGLGSIALNTKAWLSQLEKSSSAQKLNLARQLPLPEIRGTIDMIASNQSLLIANDLNYSPRPTIQEYTTYSRKLIERNRKFFQSKDAPQYLLMKPGSIDGRHPASAEGSLWPLFLMRYQTVDKIQDQLILRKRTVPIEGLLSQPSDGEASMGDNFKLANDGALFVKIDVRMTLLGKLMSFVLKPPQLYIDLQYSDAKADRFRLIPAMAREGMVLSPTIKNSLDYWLLETGRQTNNGANTPVSFSINTGWLGRLAYSEEFGVSVASINREKLKTALSASDIKPLNLNNILSIYDLLPVGTVNPPYVELTLDGLFAHAQSSITIDGGNANQLKLGYRLRRGDYKNFEGSDGVCFSARLVSTKTLLFKDCLDPRSNPSDAGNKSIKLRIPQFSKIELRTDCRLNCSYDWSMWSQIKLDTAPN